MDKSLALVALFDSLAAFLVFFCIGLGFADHAIDFAVIEPAGRLDADFLLLAGGLVLGTDLDDAVCIDIEGDLDLRHTARRRGDALEIELAEMLVVGSHLALALVDRDGHRSLIVVSRREHLALLGRDRRVAVDQAGKDAAKRLDAERQRGHVEKQDILDITGQDTGLNGGAGGNHLVRVHAPMRLCLEEFLHRIDDFRHAGHAADKDDLVNFGCLHTGIFQRRLTRLDGALHQRLDKLFQLGAGQLDIQVLRTGRIGSDEGKVHIRLHGRGQLNLGLFRSLLEALQGQLVLTEVDSLARLELVGKELDDFVIEILTAEEGVTIGRLHLEHTVADLENGDVKGAATKIIDDDQAGFALVEAIGEGRGRRLVDDTKHFKTGDLACILGGLTLRIVEIGRDRDHRLGYAFAEERLGVFLQLAQNEARDLARRIFLAIDFHPGIAILCVGDLIGDQFGKLLGRGIIVPAPDQSLDGEQGLFRVGEGLALGGLADKPLVTVGKGDHRGGRARAFGVFDHTGVLAIHDGDAGIRSSKVNTNNFGHDMLLSCSPVSSGDTLVMSSASFDRCALGTALPTMLSH